VKAKARIGRLGISDKRRALTECTVSSTTIRQHGNTEARKGDTSDLKRRLSGKMDERIRRIRNARGMQATHQR
jgi:ribosome-binding protein aMBF1 (putative translation factor)